MSGRISGAAKSITLARRHRRRVLLLRNPAKDPQRPPLRGERACLKAFCEIEPAGKCHFALRQGLGHGSIAAACFSFISWLTRPFGSHCSPAETVHHTRSTSFISTSRSTMARRRSCGELEARVLFGGCEG